jgi:hypothetical protein
MLYDPIASSMAFLRILSLFAANGSSLFSVECRTQFGTVSRVSANPKGIESISPGLRGTSYPGSKTEKSPTLKGLHPFHKALICNPFRVGTFPCVNPA